MVEAYKGYRSSNGKIHDDEHEAHLEELRTWLFGSGIHNEPMRNDIARAVSLDPHGVSEIVARIAELTPLETEVGTLGASVTSMQTAINSVEPQAAATGWTEPLPTMGV